MAIQEDSVRYADQARPLEVEVMLNQQLARDTYRIRFHCPEMARSITPGQFLMVRVAGLDDPLIGRPFALYDTALDGSGRPVDVEFVYFVGGKMTRLLSSCQPGRKLSVWGPLGNGFAPTRAEHLIMVAGGIGQTPFLALGQEARGIKTYGEPPRAIVPCRRVSLCYGARSREYLAGIAAFQAAGVDVHLSTDDGSAGSHGLVTGILESLLNESSAETRQVVCCGPERMMHAVSQLATRYHVETHVSLETPMACGIGICFTCVAPVRDEAGHVDYRRTCVEGPVFPAAKIVWDV